MSTDSRGWEEYEKCSIRLAKIKESIQAGYRKLLKDIENDTEYLQTTEGDDVECVSVENLKGHLEEFKRKINL